MKAMSTAASTIRHTLGVGAEALILLAIMAALAFGVALASGHPAGAGSVFAAKGGNAGAPHGNGGGGSTSGVAIAVPDGVFGQSDTATTSPGLWVQASCSQNGLVVYRQFVLTDSAGNAVLTLGPTPMWSGGAAICGAQAGTFSNTGAWKSVASVDFSVSG